MDKYDLPSNNLAPTLGVEFWGDEDKDWWRKITWLSTFEDNCSSSTNMTGLVTEC